MAIKIFSNSYQEFLENRKNIISLFKSSPSENQQLHSLEKKKLANSIYYGCVLLLSSYSERYVESLVVEMIDSLNSANLLVKDIPVRLKIAQIKDQLENLDDSLNKSRDERYVKDTFNIANRLVTASGWYLKDNDVFNRLSGEPLIGDNRFSNPSPEKIEKLFSIVGISSIVGRAVGLENKPDRAALRDKLEELIDKRNNIAHTGGTVTVTNQDIYEYLIYTRRVFRNIDLLVGQEVTRITRNVQPWI